MTILLIYVHFLIALTVYSIDRTQFTNFRATQTHDGYLSFPYSFNFPLTLKWTVSNTSCTEENGLLNLVFSNDIFYCLTNEVWDEQNNINSSVYAFDVNNNGKVIWHLKAETLNKLDVSALDGIVSIPPNYLSIFDNNNGNLYILNSSNGNIIHNITVYEHCQQFTDTICMLSGLVSSNMYKSIFVHYAIIENINLTNNTNLIANLFQFNIETNQSKQINIMDKFTTNPQIPTICNNNVIITTNLFGNINAFSISDNSTMISLWNYSIVNTQNEPIYINPPMCIPRVDGLFNVLVNSYLQPSNYELWILLNGKTGELLNEIKWEITHTGLPVINTDKMILIRTAIKVINNTETHYILAHNITDVYGNWTLIWNVTYSNNIMDIMIVNDNVFVSDQKQFVVYSIYNGSKVFQWLFPIETYHSRLVSSLDKNNKPIIVVAAIQSFNLPHMNTILYALQ
eukprot:12717_1